VGVPPFLPHENMITAIAAIVSMDLVE